MLKYDLNELKEKVEKDLEKQIVNSKVLLDKFCLIDEDSRKTAAYLDPNYSCFYYHLGKYIEPKTVCEFGFDLGLLSGSFLTSCKSPIRFFGYKQNSQEFSSMRLGRLNIKLVFKKEIDFYSGNLFDQEFIDIFSPNSWDLVILNCEDKYDKHLEYLEIIWPRLSENGFIIAEYINHYIPGRDAFLAFCESKNRKPVMFQTRYGTGVLQK